MMGLSIAIINAFYEVNINAQPHNILLYRLDYLIKALKCQRFSHKYHISFVEEKPSIAIMHKKNLLFLSDVTKNDDYNSFGESRAVLR